MQVRKILSRSPPQCLFLPLLRCGLVAVVARSLTSRVQTIRTGAAVYHVSWSPVSTLIAVATHTRILFIEPLCTATNTTLRFNEEKGWHPPSEKEASMGVRLQLIPVNDMVMKKVS